MSDLTRDAWAIISEGATQISPPALISAGPFLDLYGEEIRNRTYITQDDVLGEMMLRPDFTLPITAEHLGSGREKGFYAYQGRVWRKQKPGSSRSREYPQIGIELFDEGHPAYSDIEVFTRIMRGLESNGSIGLNVTMGDASLIKQAVLALSLSAKRKSELIRHLSRPQRFDQILQRYSKPQNTRLKIPDNPNAIRSIAENAGPEIGTRTLSEVLARADLIVAESREPALPSEEATNLKVLSAIDAPLPKALRQLRNLAEKIPVLQESVILWGQRRDFLIENGFDPNEFRFKGRFDFTAIEYYDGFVFSISGASEQAIATGGRYDALTRALSQHLGLNVDATAVGGVIRPDLLMEELRR